MSSRVVAVLVAGSFAAAAFVPGGAAAEVRRNGVVSKFQGVDEIVETCTRKKVFASIPKMSATFNVTGSRSAVVVTFSGSVSLGGVEEFDTGFVRLLIDDVEQSPGEVPFVSAGETSESNAFTWQSRPLAVGSHTARVEWRTDLNSSFCASARSLIVLHR